MAPRSPDIPSYRERLILQAVRYKTQMPPDEMTIAKLLKKGWLEELPLMFRKISCHSCRRNGYADQDSPEQIAR